MFITNDANLIEKDVDTAALTRWYTVELAFKNIWFIAHVCDSEGEGDDFYEFGRTMFLSHISQIKTTLMMPKGQWPRLVEVHVVTPGHVNGTNGWKIEQLSKVWLAEEPLVSSQKVHIFEAANQSIYANSILGTKVGALKRKSLLFDLTKLAPMNL